LRVGVPLDGGCGQCEMRPCFVEHYACPCVDNLVALSYKVDVRRPEVLAPAAQQPRRAIGAVAQVPYLKADFYRPDLLVEIEAVGN
jgi:hypothetical protein